MIDEQASTPDQPAPPNALHDLLGELFPAGEVADPHYPKVAKGPNAEDAMLWEKMKPSLDQLNAAEAAEPGGGNKLMEKAATDFAKQTGYEIVLVATTPKGVTIMKGAASIPLSPSEVIQLQQTLGEIIRMKGAQSMLNLFKNLLNGDEGK